MWRGAGYLPGHARPPAHQSRRRAARARAGRRCSSCRCMLGGEAGAAPASVVGALAITLPLAWRRRAPLAVVLSFAVICPLQGLLGGELFEGDPPLFGALVAGALAFYSLAAHAPDRAGARSGSLRRRRRAVGTGVLAPITSTSRASCSPAGLVAAVAVAGRPRRPRPAAARRSARPRTRPARPRRRERGAPADRARAARRRRPRRRADGPAGAGRAPHPRPATPPRARGAARRSRTTGQTALAEIRRSLGILRDERRARGARAAAEPRRPRRAGRRDAPGRAEGRPASRGRAARAGATGSTAPPTGSCRRR